MSIGALGFAVMTSVAGLPASLSDGELAACAPTTLEAAERCLADALSKEDFAKVTNKSSAREFRGILDCHLEVAWRLGDPQSPMSKALFEKIGVHLPSLAAGMIIEDMQLRAVGSAVPWDQVRKDFSNLPPEVKASTCPSTEGGNGH